VKNQGHEIKDQWFQEGFWRQYKLMKIHLKSLGVSKRKNDRKQDKNGRNWAGGVAAGAKAPNCG